MNSSSVTIQGVSMNNGVSKKTGKPYTKFEIATSGGTFGTFDTALAELARNSLKMTCAVTYEENQYGKDLKSLMVDPTAAVTQPHIEPVRSVTPDGDTDWDMIGLRKTRCALWVAVLSAKFTTPMSVGDLRELVIAAEVDIFHREPATTTSDIPFSVGAS